MPAGKQDEDDDRVPIEPAEPGSPASFLADSDLIPRRFRDNRSYYDIIQDWMYALGHPRGDEEGFLKETRLAACLTPENLRDINTGKSFPGLRLAIHFVALYDYYTRDLRADPAHASLASTRVFYERLFSRIIYDRGHVPRLDITEDQAELVRLPIIQLLNRKVLENASALAMDEEPVGIPVASTMTEEIITALREMRPKMKLSDDELLDRLSQQYRGSKKEPTLALLISSLPDAPLDKIKEWADSELGRQLPYVNMGKMLRFARLCSGINLPQAAEHLGIRFQHLYNWEAGAKLISAYRFTDIKAAYGLTDEVTNLLLTARLPALDNEWLKTQMLEDRARLLVSAYCQHEGIARGDLPNNHLKAAHNLAQSNNITPDEYERVFYLCLPALDEEWLKKQPLQLRGGLLLAAFRERASLDREDGLNQGEMGKMLGLSRQTCSNLERGISMEGAPKNINLETRRKISKALELLPEESKKLNMACLWALDADWLKQQPIKKRPGLLLAAFRERAELYPGAFSDLIKISPSELSKYESGRFHIVQSIFYKCSKTLALSPEDKSVWLQAIIDKRLAREIETDDKEHAQRFQNLILESGDKQIEPEPTLEDRIATRRAEMLKLGPALPSSKRQLLKLEQLLRKKTSERGRGV